MLSRQRLKLDLAALGLLVLTVFLGLALWSYDPADPPAPSVFPARAEAGNVCGIAGARAAHVLLSAFGSAVWVLLGVMLVWDFRLFARRPLDDFWLRAIGWVMVLAASSALSAKAGLASSPPQEHALASSSPYEGGVGGGSLSGHGWNGPPTGRGGLVGALALGLLERHFSAVGSAVLLASLLLVGLLLATDYFVLRAARVMLRPAAAAGRVALRVLRIRRAARRSSEAAKRRSGDPTEGGADARQAHGLQPVGFKGVNANRARDAVATTDSDASDGDVQDDAVVLPMAAARTLKVNPPVQLSRDEVMAELDAASRADAGEHAMPGIDLLEAPEEFPYDDHEKHVRKQAEVLEKTFADFGLNVHVVEIDTGPVITQFEILLEAGLRVSKVTALADDLAIALKVPSVRIVAPLPNKNTVGVEVPNRKRVRVRLRELVEVCGREAAEMSIPLFLGKDVSGNPLMADLARMPHLLIAGRTGTGKSVCLNSMILSILMTRRPDQVKMLMIDPKMVELSPYRKVPHLMHPVVTDMKKAEAILAWAVDKMEERYDLLMRAGVRHIDTYNQLGEEEILDRLQPADDEERKRIPTHMPYIVIFADEMADLMMTAAKEVEAHIIRLAQKSRAVGIHLVLATQKPTVDVITGLIKSNLPARIAFQVASRTDSRVVLDEMGAEKLLGNGDMLYLIPGTSNLIRAQGTFVSDEEVNAVIGFFGDAEPQYVKELVQLQASGSGEKGIDALRERDELYEQAIEIVVAEGRGSTSLLQRALGIGYGRAARLIDYMAEDGIVGDYNGSQARDVLYKPEEWQALRRGERLEQGAHAALSDAS